MSARFPPIPEFVEPYPDESCYSILCRCMVRAGLSTSRFRKEMFAQQKFLSRFLWQPFRVDELNRWFDDVSDRTHIYLLKHSCVPYRYPFLCQRCRDDISMWNAGDDIALGYYQRITKDLGCRFWTKHYLRYCPECVRSDRETYGETYWHMTPQLPGVCICPVHAVPLEESAIMASNDWMDLNPAEYWLPDKGPRRETVSYDDLCLATDSQWMMEHGWETEIGLSVLLEGLSNWDFEQAETKTSRFTSQHNVKNETLYHIFLANLKGKSISDFAEQKNY